MGTPMGGIDPLMEKGVALVTGAGSGIGRQIARQFGKHGCKKLFLVDMLASSLEETKALIQEDDDSVQVGVFQANITDEKAVKSMVDNCVEVFGRLDFACNNAGTGTANVKTDAVSVKEFDRVCDVNVKGTYLCEKYEIEQMLKQESVSAVEGHGPQRGSIINISSLAGGRVLPAVSPYAASKHSVVGLSRFDARNYARSGIRINTVSPGPTWTPMLAEAGLSQDFIDAGISISPAHRWYETTEIATTVLFLAGTGASGITGVNLQVDGGAHLYGTLY